MEHGRERNRIPYDLISDYEKMHESGETVYIEQEDFEAIIDFYTEEFQIKEALEVTEYAIRQYPYCVEFLLTKAQLLLMADKPYRAMRYLDKAEVISPGEFDIYLLRAKAFSAVAEYDQAIELLLTAERMSNPEDRLEILLSTAAVYEHMRMYDEMFDTLVKALEIDPTSPDVLERVWVSVELSKKYEESIELHEKLIENDAFSYLAWFNLGHAYSCIGEYRKAIEAIEYSFIINEDFELGYLDCAELCSQERMYEKALNIYAELIERFGADSDDMVKVAECQYFTGRIEECLETLVEALHLDPYNDEVYYLLGKCFRSEGRVHNAVGALIKAIELEDRREEYYYELAEAYASMDEPGKANYYFGKSTEVGPEQEYYWIKHCRFLLKQGEYEKALLVIEEADYHVFSPELLIFKSVCLLHLDVRKKALSVLGEVLAEYFDTHTILEEVAPELMEDEDVLSLIRYFKAEMVNTLS